MKLTMKRVLLMAFVLMLALLVAGCNGEQTPYEKNDADNYKISVKYDANGGVFTTNTTVIVDSFNASELPKNGNGQPQAALITPDDPARGNNAFAAERTGYFLAGWYASCETAEDGTQTFADRWDFATDRLTVDPDKKHSASEPVLTLYAAWVPLYTMEIYDRADPEKPLTTFQLDPSESMEFILPHWDAETGAMNMERFPSLENKTFEAAYLDAEGEQPITEAVITHPGSFDPETATTHNANLQIYMDLVDGTWFHIYNTDQFIKNARLSGSYVLHEDLDFTDKIWPSVLMYGNFTGTIEGNGHKITNVMLEQTNNSKTNAGLFGALTETAVVKDLTFSNVNLTIKSGTRVAGTSYGVLAGTVSANAQLSDIYLLDSTLTVGKDAYFGTDDYVIGTVFGTGSVELAQAQVEVIYEVQTQE